MRTLNKLLSILTAIVIILSLSACGANGDSNEAVTSTDRKEVTSADTQQTVLEEETDMPSERWLASWGVAIQKGESSSRKPTVMALENNTIRQQVRLSYGGEKLRLTFSNEYGETPVTLQAVHLAKLLNYGKSDIDVLTDIPVTFNGSESIIIPAGGTITSDEIEFKANALDCLAVSIQFGDTLPPIYTCHTLSKCTSWIAEGNCVSESSFTQKNDKSGFYFLQRIDVMAAAETGAVICLGDSITDGQGSGGDALGSYPDQLAEMLQSDPETHGLSVINAGIAGNRIFYGAGDPCKDRIVRDVTQIPAAKYCIIMIGINDITNAKEDISQTLIDELKKMIDICHDNGILVIGATLTPVKGHKHYSELSESMRKTLNAFISSSDSGFDAYVDMSAKVADESDSEQIKKEFTSDFLHLNRSGYELLAEEAFEVIKMLEAE